MLKSISEMKGMLYSKRDLAEELGYKDYDTALPQTWVDAAYDRGWDVVGHFVWSYEKNTLVGNPLPVTKEGLMMLGEMGAYL